MSLLGIPFYCHPVRSASSWQALSGAAHRVGLAVVNVDSGPGAHPDPAYATALTAASRVPWAGYVHLDYGHRPVDEALADVARWRRWYTVTDVMLDCVPAAPEASAWVAELTARIRGLGAGRVVGNPGVPVPAATAGCFDVVGTSEQSWRTYRDRPTDAAAAGPRSWHLVHGCPEGALDEAVGLMAGRGAGLVWATTGHLPNPWAEVPAALLGTRPVAGLRNEDR